MEEHNSLRSKNSGISRLGPGSPGLRGLGWLVVLGIAGILAAGSPVMAVDEPASSGQLAEACSAPELGVPTAVEGGSATANPEAGSDAAGWRDGRWRRMPRAPFAAAYGPAIWTGKRMVVVSPEDGRTAKYDAARDRWREVATAPRPTETFTPSLWTGRELVIVEVGPDFSSIGGLAYDPAADRWRELARLPFVATARDHALADAIWTGTHIVVVESDGLVAALDVTADCWTELGRVPGDSVAWHLYLDGPRLLVESRDRGTTSVRSFEPTTGVWSEPAVASFEVAGRQSGAYWADDVLKFISWTQSDSSDGASAMFDPATMTWARTDHDCKTAASRSIDADGLLVSADGRRVLDPATLACTVVPKPPRRLNGTESTLWTGSELIAWGGTRESLEPLGGSIYTPRPPAGE